MPFILINTILHIIFPKMPNIVAHSGILFFPNPCKAPANVCASPENNILIKLIRQ